MADNEFMVHYRAALAIYSEEDWEAFFSNAGITDKTLQALGKDFLGVAGSIYLSHMARQSEQMRRTDALKHLKKSQKASLALAENLTLALRNKSIIDAMMKLAPSIRAEFPTKEDREKDSYQILDAIFPLSSKGKGFRYEGLARALEMLARSLNGITPEMIEKPDTGRSHALRPWMILVLYYWHYATGDLPSTGHYYSEVADYLSPSIDALTHMAEKLDSNLSQRLIVQALGTAAETFENNLLETTVLMSGSFVHLISSGEAQASIEAFSQCSGIPLANLDSMTKLKITDPDPDREKMIITPEEFSETFKSAELEKMLFPGSIETDQN